MLGNTVLSLEGGERKAWKKSPGRGNQMRKCGASLGVSVWTGVAEGTSGGEIVWQMNPEIISA